MFPYAPYVVAYHVQDLLEEAELARRAKLARRANDSVSAWRRGLGGLLASAARVADPCIELADAARRSRERSGRAFAA